MRKLVMVTLGFGMSCALCVWLIPKTWLLWILLMFAVGFAVLAWSAGRSGILRRGVLILLGCVLGVLCFSLFYTIHLKEAVSMDGRTETVRIHVTDFGYETDYGSAAECDVVLEGKTCHCKVYLKEEIPLEPGMELEGDFRFRVTTPDGEKPATYHQGRGTFLLLYQKGEVTTHAGRQGWQDKIAVLRRNIQTILETAFPEDTVAFAKALLLGDTRDLGYEVDTNLKISGIRHVAAVSGLHVSILFTLLSTVTLKNRYLTAMLGFPALFAFAALAGFTPSVSRSCLMLSLTLLGLLLEKEYDGPTALSFAVLIMLSMNPLTITDIGFQLSVGSVAGIFAFSERIRRWIAGLFGNGRGFLSASVRWLTASVATTLSAMITTTPLCALYFGTVSLIGVVTNMLTLWVVSFIFYGILAVCLVGIFWTGAASVLAWLTAWPVRYVLAVAKLMADLPLAAVYTQSVAVVLWLIFVYLLLAGLWLGKGKAGISCCLGVLGLCLALLASWYRPMTDDIRFTMLDVGQGQCILLQSGGRTVLVDCGGDSDSTCADLASQTLLSQGISRLDAVILTHGDRDHAGGMSGLLSRVDTELLILPQDAPDLAGSTSGRVLWPDQDIVLSIGDAKVYIYVAKYPGNASENSLCILFDTKICDILITGDRDGFGERSLLRNASIPDVDILVAGHHGSATSVCEELLEAVRPEIVCISAGQDNAYGHPAEEVLQRLKAFGCSVYRTDLNGTILIRR